MPFGARIVRTIPVWPSSPARTGFCGDLELEHDTVRAPRHEARLGDGQTTRRDHACRGICIRRVEGRHVEGRTDERAVATECRAWIAGEIDRLSVVIASTASNSDEPRGA
jgi:hypothetical protein